MKDSVCANSYLTSYKHEYPPKFRKPERFQRKIDIDPITSPYCNYLRIDNCRMKPTEPSEQTSDFLKRMHQDYPKLAKAYFHSPPNYETLCKQYEMDLYSTYQKDICHDGDIVQKGKRPIDLPFIDLPENWYFPVTTNEQLLRNPRTLMNRNVKSKMCKPDEKDSFVLSDEMMRIMKISTGLSQYEQQIGALGQFIIDNEMHGEIHI